MICRSRFLFLAALGGFLAGNPAVADPITLKSGDTVVLVGNTFVERAQRYGHVETMLELAAGPEVSGLKFRNLGWSGDSVFGDARSYFGAPKEGRDRLAKGIGELKPNLLLVCYGTGAAMSGQQGWTVDPAGADQSRSGDEASLKLFVEQYGKLLDLMQSAAGESLREIVLIAPPPLENLGPPLPDQVENNKRLAVYRDAIRGLAEKRGNRFVDLFGSMDGDNFSGDVADPPLTDNGIHYGESGYRLIANELVKGLGLALPEGLLTTDAEVEAMRANVIKKNRLFFHRWRPANETYLFLFRKHEQGQNAKEIPMFDPLIAAEEKKIGIQKVVVFEKLKKP